MSWTWVSDFWWYWRASENTAMLRAFLRRLSRPLLEPAFSTTGQAVILPDRVEVFRARSTRLKERSRPGQPSRE